jgi:RNA recognition motif-containing protein
MLGKRKEGMNIYVGNMPFNMNEDQLRDLFAAYGDIDSVKVITDRETHRSRGFGFVEMPDDESARKAISELSEKEINGRRLNINEARPREERRGHGGGRGGGNRW